MSNRSIEDRLARARSRLLISQPFIGNLMLNLKFEIKEDLSPPTAATDGRKVWFHPGFVNSLNDEELIFLVAHETMHPMFHHTTRRQSREPRRWNVAADIVINQMLTDDGVGRMPACGVLEPQMFKDNGGITERIYNALENKNIGEAGAGCSGSGKDKQLASHDNMTDETGNHAEAEAEWQIRVAGAAQMAKAAGKLSAAQARFVDEVLTPKVDWRTVLARFVIKQKDDDRTWARPNRRFVQQGMYLPSKDGEAMGPMVVAIDCSGSIGVKQLNEFAAEIRSICENVKPTTLHIVYFDSEVCHYDKFEKGEDIMIAPHGGGGTAFSPIFKYIENHNITPVACVVLTDLMCSDFGPEPEYPVLWVSTHEGKAPWGEITYMF